MLLEEIDKQILDCKKRLAELESEKQKKQVGATELSAPLLSKDIPHNGEYVLFHAVDGSYAALRFIDGNWKDSRGEVCNPNFGVMLSAQTIKKVNESQKYNYKLGPKIKLNDVSRIYNKKVLVKVEDIIYILTYNFAYQAWCYDNTPHVTFSNLDRFCQELIAVQ